MAIWCLGSVNADHVYRVPHLPGPGETLAATGFSTGLGGKGANMAVAAARAGASVSLIGAVGAEGAWMRERLAGYGVTVSDLAVSDLPSGHAIILVDGAGENVITILPGANRALGIDAVQDALSRASAGDIFLCQNETNLQREAAGIAADMGLRVAYAAAPFDADAVTAMLDVTDLLILNAVEAAQLEEATGKAPADLPVAHVVVTRGAEGVIAHDTATGGQIDLPPFRVEAVDTTGAGDTFTGFLLAALDGGRSMPAALYLASRAAALKVTRQGTADVIPTLDEVEAWVP